MTSDIQLAIVVTQLFCQHPFNFLQNTLHFTSHLIFSLEEQKMVPANWMWGVAYQTWTHVNNQTEIRSLDNMAVTNEMSDLVNCMCIYSKPCT